MRELILFGFGMIVGSFLNVCAFRIPENVSIVTPRSRCRSCRKAIAWFDNVPLLSYLVLRGRCRHCRQPIARQYPLVEAGAGALFVIFDRTFGVGVEGVVYLTFTLALLVASLIDWKHRILPDRITLPGLAAGVILSAAFPFLQGVDSILSALGRSLLALLLGGGFFYVSGMIAEAVLKKEAIGGGDIKLMAMIGALLGPAAVFWTLFVSSCAGSVVGLGLKWARGDERIPFGPFLAAGAVSYIFFGSRVIAWYLGAIGWQA